MDTLYLWRLYLPDLTGKLKPSRWRMAEEVAQARHPGCTEVAGSLEVRQFERDTGHSMDAGLVRRDGAATAAKMTADASSSRSCPMLVSPFVVPSIRIAAAPEKRYSSGPIHFLARKETS
jgi:hypothetical protein